MIDISQLYEIAVFNKGTALFMWLILTAIGLYVIVSLDEDE